MQKWSLGIPCFDRTHPPLKTVYGFCACRSPWKRLFEVMFLVLITAALWFSVAYSSPCKALPVQVSCATSFCSTLYLPHVTAMKAASV